MPPYSGLDSNPGYGMLPVAEGHRPGIHLPFGELGGRCKMGVRECQDFCVSVVLPVEAIVADAGGLMIPLCSQHVMAGGGRSLFLCVATPIHGLKMRRFRASLEQLSTRARQRLGVLIAHRGGVYNRSLRDKVWI